MVTLTLSLASLNLSVNVPIKGPSGPVNGFQYDSSTLVQPSGRVIPPSIAPPEVAVASVMAPPVVAVASVAAPPVVAVASVAAPPVVAVAAGPAGSAPHAASSMPNMLTRARCVSPLRNFNDISI